MGLMKEVDVIVKVYEVDFHKASASTAVSRKSVNTSFDELKVDQFNAGLVLVKAYGYLFNPYYLSTYW